MVNKKGFIYDYEYYDYKCYSDLVRDGLSHPSHGPYYSIFSVRGPSSDKEGVDSHPKNYDKHNKLNGSGPLHKIGRNDQSEHDSNDKYSRWSNDKYDRISVNIDLKKLYK